MATIVSNTLILIFMLLCLILSRCNSLIRMLNGIYDYLRYKVKLWQPLVYRFTFHFYYYASLILHMYTGRQPAAMPPPCISFRGNICCLLFYLIYYFIISLRFSFYGAFRFTASCWVLYRRLLILILILQALLFFSGTDFTTCALRRLPHALPGRAAVSPQRARVLPLRLSHFARRFSSPLHFSCFAMLLIMIIIAFFLILMLWWYFIAIFVIWFASQASLISPLSFPFPKFYRFSWVGLFQGLSWLYLYICLINVSMTLRRCCTKLHWLLLQFSHLHFSPDILIEGKLLLQICEHIRASAWRLRV